ncbi:MAG TPA: response regulator transcription factor [Pyrinomonadaceae bacterium]|nr:response regulator transcription factor [Pyrinomonadaceae bacterium]
MEQLSLPVRFDLFGQERRGDLQDHCYRKLFMPEMSEKPSVQFSRPKLIKVAIIEDQQAIREGLAVLIGGTDGFVCTSGWESMEAALAGLPASRPDVVLVDLGLPGMSGIEGIRLIKQQYPDLLVLVLTVFGDDDRIFNAICAGARGYLLKKTPPARLLESIEEIVSGGAPMSPEVARRVVELFQKFRPPAQAEYHLTPHETRLLQLLVEGHNYKTAAREIGSSIHAVSFHMKNIYEKLQVHSKSEAVAKALRYRLTE